jgi:hypothetical protein
MAESARAALRPSLFKIPKHDSSAILIACLVLCRPTSFFLVHDARKPWIEYRPSDTSAFADVDSV